MSNTKYIYLVSKSDTLEMKELTAAAEKLGVQFRISRAETIEETEEIANNASVVLWRSGQIVNQFPTQIIKPTVWARIAREAFVINQTSISNGQLYKSVQQQIFSKYQKSARDIKPLTTFLAANSTDLLKLIVDNKLTYPFIAKPNFGRCGEGIELIKSEDDLSKLGDTNTYVYQPYVQNTGDYRVLVIGGTTHMVFKRVATKNSSQQFLNNLSQGGERQIVEDTNLFYKLSKAGPVIAAMFDYAIAGVDILEGEDGTLYFLEINSVPQWFGWEETTDHSVAEHVVKLLSALSVSKDEKNIFSEVERYYQDNLDYLSSGTRFHYLSRMHLWSGKKKYREEIEAARDQWWSIMPEVLLKLKDPSREVAINDGNKTYRKEAREKHPFIVPYNNFFFKCVFDRTIFEGTSFEDYKDSIDLVRLENTRDCLLMDPQSLFTLSTPAVNFLYHYNHFLGNKDDRFQPKELLAIPEKYKLDDPAADFDARIYYYTHMIIGATRFYADALPEEDKSIYVEALKRVEELISKNYINCTIDQKAEFMVCARICGHESPLEAVIRSELAASCSPHGVFLINTHNNHKENTFKKTLETAEHSNVLALMAFSTR